MILKYEGVYYESNDNCQVTMDQLYKQLLELRTKEIVPFSNYDAFNINHVVLFINITGETDLKAVVFLCNQFNYPFEFIISEKVRSVLVENELENLLKNTQIHVHERFTYNGEYYLVKNDSNFKKKTTAVIIASYNYGSFLIEAIESVLRQTFLPDEILITDDCSEDNTQEIASIYVEKYPDLIKFNRNPTNLGIVQNFNKAVSLTKSDYICFLGADNRFRSDYIERTSEILDCNPRIGIAYTDFALFGPRARIVYDSFNEEWKGSIKYNEFYIINFPEFDTNAIETIKEGKNFIHGSSMYRREAFEEVGGYLQESTVPEDFNLFSRMISQGWLAKKVNQPLLEYRQHSRDQANNKMISYAELAFYKDAYKKSNMLIEDKEKYINWLENTNGEKDKGIQWLENQLLERNEGIEWLKAQLKEKDEGIEWLKTQLKEKDEGIEWLKAQLKEKDEGIKWLEGELENRNNDMK
ncbi:Glycosyl transferase family 2 [Fontibacillus panacisegetis]|uniref:Glycosyl transferase family 2 n=1 Tax=Fontibacillus panacisegetis TaxID=670482 RepID=A0A1G7SZG2_9BACL|nr:glycosyltransferase [Fontibacillus panacisegetis]SDG28457.1 Glycosyl transferase family 2 [Fontibacillus panacisegetis]